MNASSRLRRPGIPMPMLLVLGAVFVLSIGRVLANTPDVTSSDTFGAALRLALPIGLAGFGGLVSERAGVVNIGLEGMMILGTWGAGSRCRPRATRSSASQRR